MWLYLKTIFLGYGSLRKALNLTAKAYVNRNVREISSELMSTLECDWHARYWWCWRLVEQLGQDINTWVAPEEWAAIPMDVRMYLRARAKYAGERRAEKLMFIHVLF